MNIHLSLPFVIFLTPFYSVAGKPPHRGGEFNLEKGLNNLKEFMHGADGCNRKFSLADAPSKIFGLTPDVNTTVNYSTIYFQASDSVSRQNVYNFTIGCGSDHRCREIYINIRNLSQAKLSKRDFFKVFDITQPKFLPQTAHIYNSVTAPLSDVASIEFSIKSNIGKCTFRGNLEYNSNGDVSQIIFQSGS